MSENRRQFQRIHFETAVTLEQDNCSLRTDVVDISLKGLLIKGDDLPFTLDKPIDIRIPLSDDVTIAMTAMWSHSRNGASGFQWIQVDLESLTHLRRLLELNSEDAILLERELIHLSQDED